MLFHNVLLFGCSTYILGAAGAAISLRSPLLARSNTGQATFYGGNVQGGHCSFSTYTLPSGIYGVASANWDNSAHCGACVSVTGPNGNKITAQIVDECPGCGTNHLDLFPDAFAALAEPSKGVIDVSWDYVTCPITAPLSLHCKSGVSQHWFSMQVVGANRAIKSLEASADGGESWSAGSRKEYNFFEISSGIGSSMADIRITSDDGKMLVVPGVQIASDASTTARSNFDGPGAQAQQSDPSATTGGNTSDATNGQGTNAQGVNSQVTNTPQLDTC